MKSRINNIDVNVSANQVSGLYSQSVIDKLDEFVGQRSLYKRSLLLVKAWAQYESPRHTNGCGGIFGGGINTQNTPNAPVLRLSSWAITVMLSWIFNLEGSKISHPLQALGHFLRYYSTFDWNERVISVRGNCGYLCLWSIHTYSHLFTPTHTYSHLLTPTHTYSHLPFRPSMGV